MNKGLCSVFLFFIICVSCGYPQQYTEIINGGGKVYFCINPKDRQIVLPVQLNDSITARLGFDTEGQFKPSTDVICACMVDKYDIIYEFETVRMTIIQPV